MKMSYEAAIQKLESIYIYRKGYDDKIGDAALILAIKILKERQKIEKDRLVEVNLDVWDV